MGLLWYGGKRTYTGEGFGHIDEDESDRQSPSLDIEGPESESDENDYVAEDAADNQKCALGTRVVFEPVINSFSVVMRVVQKALDLEE